MNEHIHELISSYLHGGNTPAQDRELFEACSKHPETAELLRSHLILSLKLRSLREQTEVPTDIRNSLLLRVNELQSERERNPLPTNLPRERVHRFGWAHILGSSLATAAAAAMLFIMWPDASGPSSAELQTTDTVRLVKLDTVVQTRNVDKPVYITRVVRERAVVPADNFVEAPPANNESELPSNPTPVTPELENVTFAEVVQVKEQLRQAKVSQYLEQYNSMLASVESVQLSSRDRVSQ